MTLKTGQAIKVRQFALTGETFETARVARHTSAMGQLPAGYVPVRFDRDGGRMLVHVSLIDVLVNTSVQ